MGVSGGGGDGRKEWRTVSERVMEAIQDKADELDVNPEEFQPERWTLEASKGIKNVFSCLSVDCSSSSMRLLAVASVYLKTLLTPLPLFPSQTRQPVFRLRPITAQINFSRDKTRKPFTKGCTKQTRQQEVAGRHDCC